MSISVESEKRLTIAVLERAVDDFRTYATIPTARARRLFDDVAAWFGSSAAGPFDFEGICHANGLEPDFIRRGLHRWDRGGMKAPVSASAPPIPLHRVRERALVVDQMVRMRSAAVAAFRDRVVPLQQSCG